MIEAQGQGLWREVSAPRFGQQDQGEAPGGPQDRFSWMCARLLLGDTGTIRTWELVLPPVLTVTEPCVGVLTGGDFDRVLAGGRPVFPGTVFRLDPGERIEWGTRRMGFRTYLALCPRTSDSEARVGVDLGISSVQSGWRDEQGALRVLPGPETSRMPQWHSFLQSLWVTGLSLGDEGLRLEGRSTSSYQGSIDGMVSAPVADGTLQLTPDGMILLLRDRPTVGGYPRVGGLVDADVDLAAQMAPRRKVRFRPIAASEAEDIRSRQQEVLLQYRGRLCS